MDPVQTGIYLLMQVTRYWRSAENELIVFYKYDGLKIPLNESKCAKTLITKRPKMSKDHCDTV